MRLHLFLLLLLTTICGDSLCKTEEPQPAPVYKAVCVLLSPFNHVNGLITFTREDKVVRVNGKISGLTPGLHGLHIHDKGDIRDPRCSTVGPHFNPFKTQHGGADDKLSHTGDLGNIKADDTGTAFFSFTNKLLKLDGPNSIVGRSVVVHAKVDDLGRGKSVDSKLTGDSGERVACGVIGYG